MMTIGAVYNRFLKHILENNTFENQIFLLVTPRTVIDMFGYDKAHQVRGLIVNRWREIAAEYRRAVVEDILDIPSCLCIAVLQTAIGFMDPKNKPDDGSDTLGAHFAKIWGVENYEDHFESYFNPSKEDVNSGMSLQYAIWSTLQRFFHRSEECLKLTIPPPRAHRDRYQQFIKDQVYISYKDITQIVSKLDGDRDFINMPTLDTVHSLIFDRYRDIKGFLPSAVTDVVKRSESEGNQLERFFSCIIFRHYNLSKRHGFSVRSLRNATRSKNTERWIQWQLRLETNEDEIDFYLYALSTGMCKNITDKQRLLEYFDRRATCCYGIFYEANPITFDTEYILAGKKVPNDRGTLLVIAGTPDEALRGTYEWKHTYKKGQIFYWTYCSTSSVLPNMLTGQRELVSSPILLSGGLLIPNKRWVYLAGAGPTLPSTVIVRKIGTGVVQNYDPTRTSSGRYVVHHAELQFDVETACRPAAQPKSRFGFDLTNWKYTSDDAQIHLDGLNTSNPYQKPATRQWIDNLVQLRNQVKREMTS